MAKESKELAKVEEAQFPALMEGADVLEALKENLGGDDVSPFDLDRVQIPTGGGLAWTVPALDGKAKPETELIGIIVGVQRARAYWKESFDQSGGGSPPDCTSDDAIIGVGDPGGECAVCPMAEFGSKEGRRGQACKAIMRLFLLRPDSMLPLVVNLPPTSLKDARKYLLRLAGQGHKMHAAVSRITLEGDKNKDGIAFSKAAFALAGVLSKEQAAAAAGYAKAIAPALRKAEPEDFLAPEEKIAF